MINFSEYPDWALLLKSEYEKDYFRSLLMRVDRAYDKHKVFPPKRLILNALRLCRYNDLKVVIIGQDPYHSFGQASGLSFSVNDGIPIPPSLKNIFKELQTDIKGFVTPASGNLEAWAKQGVLLLNSVLTVEANIPGSHKSFGWQKFTDSIIKMISGDAENLVFLLWGNYAISKAQLIDTQKHLILKAAHPSPLARGAFFGNKHFSKANEYLTQHHKTPIIWNLT